MQVISEGIKHRRGPWCVRGAAGMPPDSDPPVRALHSEQRQQQQDKRSAESSVNGPLSWLGTKQVHNAGGHGLQFNAQQGIIHVLYRCQTILLFYIYTNVCVRLRLWCVCLCVCVKQVVKYLFEFFMHTKMSVKKVCMETVRTNCKCNFMGSDWTALVRMSHTFTTSLIMTQLSYLTTTKL